MNFVARTTLALLALLIAVQAEEAAKKAPVAAALEKAFEKAFEAKFNPALKDLDGLFEAAESKVNGLKYKVETVKKQLSDYKSEINKRIDDNEKQIIKKRCVVKEQEIFKDEHYLWKPDSFQPDDGHFHHFFRPDFSINRDFSHNRAPAIFLSHSKLDIDEDHNLRLEMSAKQISYRDFYLFAKTWGDTHIHAWKVMWMACAR